MRDLTGGIMSVVLDLSYTVSIWISAAVAITYTLLGGLYSVAYTDVIQLILIFLSLVRFLCQVFMKWLTSCWKKTPLLLKECINPHRILCFAINIFIFVSTVHLCPLCYDESLHSGHQSNADEQHLACSLDWPTRDRKNLDNNWWFLILCNEAKIFSISNAICFILDQYFQ